MNIVASEWNKEDALSVLSTAQHSNQSLNLDNPHKEQSHRPSLSKGIVDH